MYEIPRYIDGAEVLRITKNDLSLISATVPMDEKSQQACAKMFAVCRYPGDESVFLFACNSEGHVLDATPFENIEEAMKAAQERFDRLLSWKEVTHPDR